MKQLAAFATGLGACASGEVQGPLCSVCTGTTDCPHCTALHRCRLALAALQVIQLLEKPRDPPLKYVFVDTPGQIEIFTWSASGQLITGAEGLGCCSVGLPQRRPAAVHLRGTSCCVC